MVLETEQASDHTRVRGILGVYTVEAVVPDELYEYALHRKGRSVSILGFAYSEREALEKIRAYDTSH